jgi:alanine racemase
MKWQKVCGKIVQAHIKIDTGFGRYGFVYSSELANEIVSLFANLNSIKVSGMYSHFSQSFEKSENATKKQFEKFMKLTNELKNKHFDTGLLHICNSPAFLKYKQMHLDAVRIGSAFTGRVQTQGIFGLQKVGYLESAISDIKILPKGHRVGYANTCKLTRETKVAIVEAGYAEGIGVRGSKDTYRFIDRLRIVKDDIFKIFNRQRIIVNINCKDCRVVGRVAMKNIIVDITDIDAKIGDKVKINVNLFFVDSSINRQEL